MTGKRLPLMLALFWAGPLLADTVYLTDGSTKEGRIVRADDNEIELEMALGRIKATIAIPRKEVRRIERGPTANERRVREVERRRAALKDKDADGWFRFGQWLADRSGFADERRRAYQKAVAADPNHARAHAALGHVRVDGRWLSKEEMMAEKGLVPYQGRYVTPDERDRLARRDAQVRAEIAREMTEARHGQRPPSAEQRRRRQVAEALARDPDVERARLDRRYRRHHTLLGRLGYYEAYPAYVGGLPVHAGVWYGGSFYGTVGYVPHRHVTAPARPGRLSPGIVVPTGSGSWSFGTNFARGGGWALGGSGKVGGVNFGLSLGGFGQTRIRGSGQTRVLP